MINWKYWTGSAAIILLLTYCWNTQDKRTAYESYLSGHAFLNRDHSSIASIRKQDRPDLAQELDFILTMDPATKRPERERLWQVYEDLGNQNQRQAGPGASATPWVERGPNNVAGRTRALIFDPNTSNKVWAGSVSGGLWYNDDITNANSDWKSVDDFWSNLAVSSIAFDPNKSNIMYVGTGEGWFNLDAVRGAGIWKSTNGGSSWTQLSATTTFTYVNDLVVRNESGSSVLYAALSRTSKAGIQRSVDGGATFTGITNLSPTDLSLGAGNRLWAGTDDGQIFLSDNGTTWTSVYNSGMSRVALAASPSNANYVYALIEDNSEAGEIVRTKDQGATWENLPEPEDADGGIPATDFTRGQAWYDLTIAVHPDNPALVVVGGIDLFMTNDEGNNWSQISRWYRFSGTQSAVVHADQHSIVFEGSGSNRVVFGNDGGVYFAPDLSNAANSEVIESRNKNYNVTQFYSCAIHPTTSTDYFLAGAQDNGTQRFANAGINSTTDVFGGDGAFCFIDQTEPDHQIVSYIFNTYGLSKDNGNSFNISLQDNDETGLFINPADYDDVLNILYSSATDNGINRISGVTTTPSIDTLNISLGAKASHLRVSPYTSNSTTLFVGTLAGKVFKVLNAHTDSPTISELTFSSFPTGSVSCIELGASEMELLVTFSNYGVTSVWYSNDGGSTWQNKEGDLPDMPVRWALFNPNNRSEVILATEMGIWSTSNLSSTSPSWEPSINGMANVRVDMLQIRAEDNEVIAATHGRGLFSSNAFQVQGVPSANFVAAKRFGCGNSLTVNFSNTTNANPAPTAYLWEFPGGTPGTSTDETPVPIVYTTPGNYDVRLTVTNGEGQHTVTKANYISLGQGATIPFEEGFEDTAFPPDCWTSFRGLNGLGTTSDWTRTTQFQETGQGAAFVEYEATSGAGLAEDWLVTPLLNLTGGFKYELSFMARDTYEEEFGSQYDIKVSTTSATNISSFTTIQTFSESDFTNSFTQHIVDLSQFADQAIYIAFVMSQDDGDDWILDDVAVKSEEIQIQVNGPLTFCLIQPSTLSVTDNPDHNYQWLVNGAIIDGATTANHSPQSTGSYQVQVAFGGKTFVTEAVEIVVKSLDIPVINQQPQATAACANDPITLSIAATGENLIYQWYFNGEAIVSNNVITGSKTASLQISAANETLTGDYYCEISDRCNLPVVSEQIALQVNVCLGQSNQTEDLVELFPNPTTQFVAVRTGNLSKITQISVFEIGGRKLDVPFVQNADGYTVLDLDKLSKGIYIIRLELADKTIIKRINKN